MVRDGEEGEGENEKKMKNSKWWLERGLDQALFYRAKKMKEGLQEGGGEISGSFHTEKRKKNDNNNK